MNTTITPSGGWQFYQPETGWNMPEPMNQTFESAVRLIASHRRANPALAGTAGDDVVRADLLAYTTSRMGTLTPAPATLNATTGGRRSCCGG